MAAHVSEEELHREEAALEGGEKEGEERGKAYVRRGRRGDGMGVQYLQRQLAVMVT